MMRGIFRSIKGSITTNWHELLNYLYREFVLKGVGTYGAEQVEHDLSLERLVVKAHAEWLQAKAYFEEANDPDLVDYAIFMMEAAERKYMYLLKLAKQEGTVKNNIILVQERGLA